MQTIDPFVIKNVSRFSVPEFTCAVFYYLNHLGVCSLKLREVLISKIREAPNEFNQTQLNVF